MKMTKKTKLLSVILAIAFLSYNILLFLIGGFTGHSSVFWISYVFVLVAFASIFCCGVVLGTGEFSMRDWLFGYPLIKHTYIYSVTQFVISVIFMLLEHKIFWKLAFAVGLVLFCVYLVFAISCLLAKQTIDDVAKKNKEKTDYIKLLRVDAALLEEKTQNPQLRALCHKFAEDVRYSDPMSCEALFGLECDISLCVADCSAALSDGNEELARELIEKASRLLSERNKKCMVLK